MAMIGIFLRGVRYQLTQMVCSGVGTRPTPPTFAIIRFYPSLSGVDRATSEVLSSERRLHHRSRWRWQPSVAQSALHRPHARHTGCPGFGTSTMTASIIGKSKHVGIR